MINAIRQEPSPEQLDRISKIASLYHALLCGLHIHHEGREFCLDVEGNLCVRSDKSEVYLLTMVNASKLLADVADDEYSRIMDELEGTLNKLRGGRTTFICTMPDWAGTKRR